MKPIYGATVQTLTFGPILVEVSVQLIRASLIDDVFESPVVVHPKNAVIQASLDRRRNG